MPLLLLCALSAVFAQPQLVKVLSILRHGDRAPIATFPNDPNQSEAWPVGWGQLTTKGMEELYQQGLKLKKRYVDELKFLNATYKADETYFRSTDYDRTLASAQSMLLGLYCDSEGTYPQTPTWPKRVSPIPVHTVAKNLDHLLYGFRACPRAIQLGVEQTNSKKFMDYVDAQKDFFAYLTKSSGGFPVRNTTELYYILDPINCEKIHNLTLAPWMTDAINEKGQKILERTFGYLHGTAGFGQPENTELMKLNSGVLLQDVIDRFLSPKEPKFVSYVTHDTTVAVFLFSLGAKRALVGAQNVDYAVMLALELWKDKGEFYVSLQYSANASKRLKTVTNAISGCPSDKLCPLSTFIERCAPYVVKNAEKECMIY